MGSPWIKKLGIYYEPRKKGYYKDEQKIEGSINYWRHFIEQYLGCELQLFRRTPITKKEVINLKATCITPKQSSCPYNEAKVGVKQWWRIMLILATFTAENEEAKLGRRSVRVRERKKANYMGA